MTENENPLDEVNVSMDNKNCVTDEEGKCRIEGLYKGNYDLLLTKDGYYDYAETIEINKDREIEIKMYPTSGYKHNGMLAWYDAFIYQNKKYLWSDNSGKDNHAIIANGKLDSLYYKSLVFSSTGPLFTLPFLQNTFAEGFTFDVTLRDHVRAANSGLFGDDKDTANGGSFYWRWHDANNLGIGISSTAAQYNTINTALIPYGYYNLTVTYNGYIMNTYINGILINTKDVGYTPRTASPMYMGRSASGSEYKGEVKSVIIYNRALSQSEVQHNYDVHLARGLVRNDNLVASFKANNHGLGYTTFYDTSGNNNNGVMTNVQPQDFESDGSLRLKGVDPYQYITLNGLKMDYLNNNGGSIEAIVKFNDRANNQTLIGDVVAGNSLKIGSWTGGNLNSHVTSTKDTSIPGNQIPTGYFHYALTFDKNILRGYVNGVIKTDYTNGAAAMVANPIIIGRMNTTAANYSKSNFKFIKFYDKPLTEIEVVNKYNAHVANGSLPAVESP